ncbi:MAG: rubrerythrin family protein [Candidatus Loosdrechtia sp.]|uniref:rubrerythrin family protein n=1 Tax=Candidatus Loosdrechtia sp. TaxID=3101272 RepID=UPI003A7486AE|nr:MAG: rubrerythrin family protein [Candidatus Jettenia sp. AMX2]
MKAITEQHLINAFGGESQAHMRYLHFANQADKENFSNVARLFRAISHAEYIHAGDHFRELVHLEGGFVANSMAAFGPGDTKKNLRLAIMGENFEITEMYPAYIEVAKFQGEKGAEKSFQWAYGTEKMHKALFEKAKANVDKGIDVTLGPIQVCNICGYTLEGEAPDKCPLCEAKKENFVPFA